MRRVQALQELEPAYPEAYDGLRITGLELLRRVSLYVAFCSKRSPPRGPALTAIDCFKINVHYVDCSTYLTCASQMYILIGRSLVKYALLPIYSVYMRR